SPLLLCSPLSPPLTPLLLSSSPPLLSCPPLSSPLLSSPLSLSSPPVCVCVCVSHSHTHTHTHTHTRYPRMSVHVRVACNVGVSWRRAVQRRRALSIHYTLN